MRRDRHAACPPSPRPCGRRPDIPPRPPPDRGRRFRPAPGRVSPDRRWRRRRDVRSSHRLWSSPSPDGARQNCKAPVARTVQEGRAHRRLLVRTPSVCRRPSAMRTSPAGSPSAQTGRVSRPSNPFLGRAKCPAGPSDCDSKGCDAAARNGALVTAAVGGSRTPARNRGPSGVCWVPRRSRARRQVPDSKAVCAKAKPHRPPSPRPASI